MQKWIFGALIFSLCGFVQAQEDEAALVDELSLEHEESVPPENLDEIDKFDLILKEKKEKPPLESKTSSESLASLIDYLEEEQRVIDEEEQRRRQEISEKFSDKMMGWHTTLSNDVVSMANSIDSFFINTAILDSRNRTNIRFNNTASWVESLGVDNNFDFRLRLRLPNLKRKIQLEFEDDSLVDDTASSRDNLSLAQNRNPSLRGGSQGGLSFYENLWGIDTKLSTGVRYQDGVILFGRFRITKDFVLTPRQKITFIHDVFDDTSDNKGQLAILNYDYSFTKFLLLRFANEETYRDIDHTFLSTHGFSLYQQLTDRNFMSYNYRLEAINPVGISAYYLNSHLVSVNFRRRIYREHFYFEAGPGMLFPKRIDFEGLWTFTLRLELIFGNV